MGCEALPKVRDVSVHLPGGLGRVWRPSQRFETGRKALPGVWDGLRGHRGGSEGPSGNPRRVGRPSWRLGMGWEALPKVRDG